MLQGWRHKVVTILLYHDWIGQLNSIIRTCWNNFATSLIMPSSLLQVVNSLFHTCWQLGTSSANTTCWRLVGRLATRCEIFTRVGGRKPWRRILLYGPPGTGMQQQTCSSMIPECSKCKTITLTFIWISCRKNKIGTRWRSFYTIQLNNHFNVSYFYFDNCRLTTICCTIVLHLPIHNYNIRSLYLALISSGCLWNWFNILLRFKRGSRVQLGGRKWKVK
jgi:hypothetical protein